MSSEKLTMRVTWADCEWKFDRASGAGGQNVNKRATKVRCTHRASGATASSQEHREQRRNREEAFMKMAKTPEFQAWARRMAAKMRGEELLIDELVAKAMAPENIVEEGRSEGRWVPLSEAATSESNDL